MNLPIIDVFILSMLDRGAQSAYDLLRIAGVSLGASTPSLARLLDLKFVTRAEASSGTKRVRYAFRLTASGRNATRNGWKDLLTSGSTSLDLDSTLRIVDIASHYGAPSDTIRSFLRRAGTARLRLANKANASKVSGSGSKLTYRSLKDQCDARRLCSEADVLLKAAESLRRRTASIAHQQRSP
jgi:DNA-binding PadR family transcriptional regulator